LIESINQFVQTKTKTDPIPILFEVPIELLAAYFNGALVSSIDWWLENMEQDSGRRDDAHVPASLFPWRAQDNGFGKSVLIGFDSRSPYNKNHAKKKPAQIQRPRP
jgi:hypothetical protein